MDKPAPRDDRATLLFFARCEELLASRSNMTRRARTLCLRTAAEEAWRLAAAYLKAGGHTISAAEPSEAAHGVKTLPQVAEEALELLGNDYVVKRRLPSLIDVIRPILEKLTKEEPQHTYADLGQQVLRLYRARNNVAHAGYGPLWLGDLIHHAHYYLTQMIAVAVHYRETAPRRPPSEIFAERVGRYDAYASLLSKKHNQAVSVDVLLRPTLLFTAALHGNDA